MGFRVLSARYENVMQIRVFSVAYFKSFYFLTVRIARQNFHDATMLAETIEIPTAYIRSL